MMKVARFVGVHFPDIAFKRSHRAIVLVNRVDKELLKMNGPLQPFAIKVRDDHLKVTALETFGPTSLQLHEFSDWPAQRADDDHRPFLDLFDADFDLLRLAALGRAKGFQYHQGHPGEKCRRWRRVAVNHIKFLQRQERVAFPRHDVSLWPRSDSVINRRSEAISSALSFRSFIKLATSGTMLPSLTRSKSSLK